MHRKEWEWQGFDLNFIFINLTKWMLVRKKNKSWVPLLAIPTWTLNDLNTDRLTDRIYWIWLVELDMFWLYHYINLRDATDEWHLPTETCITRHLRICLYEVSEMMLIIRYHLISNILILDYSNIFSYF